MTTTQLQVIPYDQLAAVIDETTQLNTQTRTTLKTYSIGRAPTTGDPVGMYRMADASGVYDISWDGTTAVRTPVLATTLSSSPSAVAHPTDPNNADLTSWVANMLATGEGEIPAGAVYILRSRLNIDASGKKIKIRNRGKLLFDVRDANGGPMINISNPLAGSEIDLGHVEHLALPLPNYDIMVGLETGAEVPDASFGPAFSRDGRAAALHWRTNNDHAVQLVNAVGTTLKVDVHAARAMGVVVYGGHSNHIYGLVANTLADGTHVNGGAYDIHFHMNAFNCSDDAFPVTGENNLPPYDIHYWGCSATGGFGRGFVNGGGRNIHWHGCHATDTFKEGFLVLADSFYATGTPTYTYATDSKAENCGLRDDTQSGESAPGGFRVGYPDGQTDGSNHVFFVRCSSTGNKGSGFWTKGQNVTIDNCESYANGVLDHIYTENAVITGPASYISGVVLHGANPKVFGARFRKNGGTSTNAVYLTDAAVNIAAITNNDFGTEWAYPIGSTAPLSANVVISGNAGVPYMSPNIVYPTAFYGIVGRPLVMSAENLTLLPAPRDQWSLDVFCGQFGTFDGHIWTGTPDTAGLKDMVIALWKNADRLSNVDTQFHVVAANAGGSVTRKILMVGDSHIRRGHIQAQVNTIIAATTGYAVTWLGTQYCEAPNATILNEGWPGKTLTNIDTDPNIPLSVGGHFNLSAYLTNSSQTMTAGDWLIVNTGSNEVAGGGITTVADVQAQVDANKVIFDRIATQCAAIGVKLGVMYTLPFRHAPHTAHYEVARMVYLSQIIPYLSGREASGVYVIPTGASIDAVADFDVSDNVHPAVAGYQHAAEPLAAFLKYMA